MDKDKFPAECRGCYANCYACTKEKNGHRLPEIRELAARRSHRTSERLDVSK